jgi:hypothetical protein
LAEMANRLGIAVVAVTHLNKGGGGGQSVLNRFAGSIAFVAAARSAAVPLRGEKAPTVLRVDMVVIVLPRAYA